MKNKTKKIEMYIGRTDHSWSTDYIDIPIDTSDKDLVKVCSEIALKEFASDDLAFVGIYNIDEECEYCGKSDCHFDCDESQAQSWGCIK